MLVVETSAVLAALADTAPDPALVHRLSDDGDLHAPHLIDIEILHALRGLVRGGRLSADRADDVRTDVAVWPSPGTDTSHWLTGSGPSAATSPPTTPRSSRSPRRSVFP